MLSIPLSVAIYLGSFHVLAVVNNAAVNVGLLVSVKTSWTSRVSESTIQRENEKRDARIQRKARIRGPTPLQSEGAETESKPALFYFQS